MGVGSGEGQKKLLEKRPLSSILKGELEFRGNGREYDMNGQRCRVVSIPPKNFHSAD